MALCWRLVGDNPEIDLSDMLVTFSLIFSQISFLRLNGRHNEADIIQGQEASFSWLWSPFANANQIMISKTTNRYVKKSLELSNFSEHKGHGYVLH